MDEVIKRIIDIIERKRKDIINFLRELIRTPSLTNKEGDVALLLKQKMVDEGFSKVRIDKVGNVIGILKGIQGASSILYYGHMDTVPPGEMEDPYSAKILDGKNFGIKGRVIYGRGAADMKGSLAAMVIAGSVLKDIELEGDLIVTGTVNEEDIGNVGPPALFEMNDLRPSAVVVGEPTNLNLANGNRGVVRARLITRGKSCHVTMQEQGINALYKMVKVIGEILEKGKNLPSHPILGRSSWAICKIDLIPNVVNVVPSKCEVEIDVRNTPNFLPEKILKELQRIIEQIKLKDEEFEAEVSIIEREVITWTGYKKKNKLIALPFYIEPNNWLVKVARKSCRQVLGKEPELKIWKFTTEAYCFSARGIPTIGFGPGEERFCHSNNEVISIDKLILATKIYATLAYNICRSFC